MAAAAVTIPTAAFAAAPPASAVRPTTAEAHFEAVSRHAGELLTWNGGQDWMGSYTIDGKIADCLTPKKFLAPPPRWHDGVYGTKRQSAELSYIMNNWGTSSSGSVAAAARIAMLEVLNRLGYYKGIHIPGNVAAFARNDLLNAERYAGPYTRSFVFTHEPTTPGQPGGAQFNVQSAAGYAVTGLAAKFRPVKIGGTVSASVAAGGRTGTPQRFARTGTGTVGIAAVTTVTSAQMGIGSAGAAFQTLVYGLTTQIGAGGSYQNHAAAATHTVQCNCDGTGNITGHVSQAAGSAEGQYTMLVNGKAGTPVTVLASRHASTGTLKASSVPDGSLVTFAGRWRVGGHWTPWVALGGTFKVVCPVMPRVSFTSQCNCTPGTRTYTDKTVVAVANPSTAFTDTVTYTVDGVKHTLTVAPGASKTAAFTVPSGPVSFGWSWTASI
jgi:hypothetical protein